MVISRRRALNLIGCAGAGAATGLIIKSCAPTPAPAAVAKVFGITDCGIRYRISTKFTGAGFYAFGREEAEAYRVFYCEPDRGGFLPGFIDLSDGPGEPLKMSLSPRYFDESCWGICLTPEEAERRAAR